MAACVSPDDLVLLIIATVCIERDTESRKMYAAL